MPRDLGQAKRADLSGHFAGETSEQVGPLVNYLVAAGQLAVPGDGVPESARNQRDTELATRRLAQAGLPRRDTEVADRLRPAPPELGAETVFELPPDKTPTARLEPVTAKLDTLKPATARLELAAEPTEEMAEIGALAIKDEGITDDSEARTEIQKPRPIIGPAPLSPAETGMLSMETGALPQAEQLTTEELQADEDTHLQVGRDPAERATNKVAAKAPEPRRTDGAMRDTVNFYNQTQALKTGQRPHAPDAGTVPLQGRPNEYPPLPSRRYEPPPPLAGEILLQVDPADVDTGFRSDTALRPAEETARKDTDRYPEDDRRPPTLKLDSDTQKLEMQPMPALPPREQQLSGDTTFDATTILLPGSKTARAPQQVPPLPPAASVRNDFASAPATGAGDRLVPEIAPAAASGDRIVPEIAMPAGPELPRITEKVVKAPEPAPAEQPAPMQVQELLPGRKVYDPKFSELVTKRHDSARDETGALLDSAKTLALKLRRATEESRTDLLSLSARRRATTPVNAGTSTEVERRPTRNVTEELQGGRPTEPVPMDDGVRLMSDMPTARAKRSRVPTQAIGDILTAIDTKLGGGGEPLSNLLREASRRITKQNLSSTGGVREENPPADLADMPGEPDLPDDGDVDHLVAASAALRAVIESEHEADSARGETPTQEVSALPESARVVAETPLAKDLDRMWKEFSIRKTGVIPKQGMPPPRAAQAQGGVWWTLAGLLAAGVIVGGALVYVLARLGFSLR